MQEEKRYRFSDIDVPLKKYFITRMIAGGAAVAVATPLLLWTKVYSIAFVPLGAYVLYIGYLLLEITRIVNGKGMKIEAVVLEKTGDTPVTTGRMLLNKTQKKPTAPKITVMTIAEKTMVEITLKRPYADYEEGNKIIIYAPENSIKASTKDKYIMDTYYCINVEYTDYRNEIAKEENVSEQ